MVGRVPGGASRVIEAEVTSKLEAMMARVKGIRKVNSTSDNGSGSISLEPVSYTHLDVYKRQLWLFL